MWKYILRRLLFLPIILVSISILTFAMLHLAPGDPITIRFGFDPRGKDPLLVARMREDLGLNDPLPVQYLRYLGDLLHGDMGQSLSTKREVSYEIFERLPATLELTLSAMLITIVIGVPLGVLCALKRGSFIDRLLMGFSLFGVSIPSFWLGIMLILLFSSQLGWLPSMGRGEGSLIERLPYLVLPSITLAVMLMGIVTRITRSSMLDILGRDYVRVARAKGLTWNWVVIRHSLPNALIPVLTILALQFAGLMGGAVIVENIFAWPGIGRLAINSIMRRDYPVVMGTVIVFAAIVVVVNLLLDLLYTVVDPRVRLD
jgi:ABC-type dipeptide/oligopeptide/nickel transport system permease component